MPNTTYKIVSFVLGFADKLPAFYEAGVDIYEEWERHKEKSLALAEAGQAPSDEDWEVLHNRMNALESSIQSAHIE